MPKPPQNSKVQRIRNGKPVPKHEHRHYAPYMLAVPLIALIGAISIFSSKAATPGTIAFYSAGDIFVVDIDGGGLKNLTNDPSDDTHPVWSPDGTKLAFTSNRSGRPRVYVGAYDAKSRSLSNVTEAARLQSDQTPWAVWEQDGIRVSADTQKHIAPNTPDLLQADMSPDATYAVYVSGISGNYDINMYDVSTQRSSLVYAAAGDQSQPDWRP